MKILHLIHSLDYSGSARQLQLLGPAQVNGNTAVEVCCLGPDTPWSESLRQAGVAVHTLGWTRWLDFGALWNLREILRDAAPDLIHVWRLPALRTLAVVARSLLPRVVMSAPLPTNGKVPWWDRRLLQQVRCLAVASVSDQERCVQQGVVGPSLCVVPLAVEKRCQDPFSAKGPDTFAEIVCVGKLERDEGFRQAIWALDILIQLLPNTQLHLVGTGAAQPALQLLAQGLQNAGNVHFQEAQADVSNLLARAAVVWVPSQANCGRQVALEAMALGRPVIASDVPCLREVIRDGETGFLAPVGDVVTFARRTRMLLQDRALRTRIGSNARQFVERQFPLADAVARWRDVYRSAAA